jgi:hypothetical protein
MAMLRCAALGWLAEEPQGNRLRWSYSYALTPPAVPAGGAPNDFRVALARSPEATTGPSTLVIERAVLPANQKLTELPGLAPALQAIPAGWWIASGDVALRNTAPFVTTALDGHVDALTFTYNGPSARCVILSVAGDSVVDRTVAPGELVVAAAVGIASIALYCRNCTLRDLRSLDLTAPRPLRFERLARIDVASGLRAPLAQAATRLGRGLSADATDDRGWQTLQAWCRGEPGPDDPDDPHLPEPWLRGAATRAASFALATATGYAFTDGPGTARSGVGGDELLGSPLTAPAWVAYRIVDVSSRDVRTSNVVVVPPSRAAALVAPRDLTVVPPVLTYQPDRDVYGLTTTLEWQQRELPGETLATRIEEVATTGGKRVLSQSIDCRRPKRAYGKHSFPRQLDLVERDALLQWRAQTIDSWGRTSVFTPWVSGSPTLNYRPAAPVFESVTHNGRVALFRPSTPLWSADRCLRETASRVGIYRKVTDPATIDVTIAAPTALGDHLYRIAVSGADPLDRFDGGALVAQGSWHITSVESDAVTIMAPADGLGAAGLPSAGGATLRQTAASIGLHTLAGSVPVEIFDSLPLDAAGGPYLEIEDPVAKSGVLLTYRPAIQIGGSLIGALGSPVSTLPPSPPLDAPGFTAVAHLAVETVRDRPGRFGAEGTDFFGRTLIVVTLDAPSPDDATFMVRAGVTTPGSDTSPDAIQRILTRGAFGHQAPRDGHTVCDLVALPLPIPQDATVWVALQAQLADGRASPLALVAALTPEE